jgi:hypothetical protein
MTGPPKCRDTGKDMWRTQWLAKSAAIMYSARYGAPMRLYRCPFCRRWHLTTQARRASVQLIDLTRIDPARVEGSLAKDR